MKNGREAAQRSGEAEPIATICEPVNTAKRAQSRRAMERVVSALTPLALLGVWEIAARLAWIDVRFFPGPLSIVENFYYLSVKVPWERSLPNDVLVSLSRAGMGFVIGAVPAIILGVVMGLVPLVRSAIQPVVGALFPIPKVAILPLVLMIFGLGEQSKWAIIAIGVFFQLLIATTAGVANIERIYLDVGHNFRAGRIDIFRTIALPGALPVIFAGVRLGWGVSLLLLVTAEMVSAKSGIGSLIWRAWQVLAVEDMYAGLITIAAIGILSFWLLDLLERWLLPWKRTG